MTNQTESAEPVWNTRLADLLKRQGLDATPEARDGAGGVPDITIKTGDYRIVGECRFVPVAGDAQTRKLEADARHRLQVNADADAAFALAYPDSLRAGGDLAAAGLRFRFFSRAQKTDWQSGGVDDLIKEIAQAPALFSADDKIAAAGEKLHRAISGFSDSLDHQTKARMHDFLTASARDSGGMAGLILANAMLLQERIANTPYPPPRASGAERVRTLQACGGGGDLAGELAGEWRDIRDIINYAPIYDLALSVLEMIPRAPRGGRALAELLRRIQELAADPAAQRHDLMGRVYHYLLEHKKSLATYYTSVPAATLLAGASIGLIGGDFSPARLRDFRVADFACGTGTLLMAARNEIRLRHNKYLAENGDDPAAPTARAALARTLIHDVIYGMDVLKSAVHLTAATLTMQAAEARYDRTNLRWMPLGVYEDEPFVGSLELMGRKSARFFGEKLEIMEAKGIVQRDMEQRPLDKFDLVIMNPPFTRSTPAGGRFDQFSESDDKLLTARLAKLSRRPDVNGQAGLGAPFVALAAERIKADGRIAFVLPKGLTTGETWAKTRNLLARLFFLELIVTNSDPDNSSFSEDTKMAELMFVARKRVEGESAEDATTLFVNLWKRPSSPQEALFFARECCDVCGEAESGKGGHIVKPGNNKIFGSWACLPQPTENETWAPALFRDSAAYLNSLKKISAENLPMCRLDKFGDFGADDLCNNRRGKFYRADQSGAYPILFNYDYRLMPSLETEPNKTVGARCDEEEAQNIWNKTAGTLHLPIKAVRTNTAKTIGIATDRKCLSHPWISLNAKCDAKREHALHLWLNSSAGILIWFSGVILRDRNIMTRSKTSWRAMSVLDVRKIPTAAINRLDEFWREIRRQPLKPLGALAADPLRQEIDKTLATTLDADESLFTNARNTLANEPDFAMAEKD